MSDVRDRSQDAPDDRRETPTLSVRLDGQTPHDALAAYALGALDIDEQRLYELHLFVCQVCRADLATYEQIANMLPYALPRQQLPADARDRLLARAGDEASESPTLALPLPIDDERPTVAEAALPDEATTAAHPALAAAEAPSIVEATAVPVSVVTVAETVAVTQVQPRRGVRIKLESIGWAVALLCVIAAGLFVYVWSATAPHASAEVEMLARLPGGELLLLSGTGAPTASARLYAVENGRRAELTVDALPPLARGRVYQIWFTEAGQPPRTGGAFGVDPHGDAVAKVAIPTPLERVREITVTQEAAPGGTTPTGVPLLGWTP